MSWWQSPSGEQPPGQSQARCVLQQCCSCRHWAKKRGYNTGAMPAWHSPLPYSPQGAAPSPGFGQSCTALAWKIESFASPGCFQARTAPNHRAAVPLAEKLCEELWGRVNLKSWLKRAPNTSLPHLGPSQGDPHTAAGPGVLQHPPDVDGPCS